MHTRVRLSSGADLADRRQHLPDRHGHGVGEVIGIVSVLSEKFKMTDELMEAMIMRAGSDAILS